MVFFIGPNRSKVTIFKKYFEKESQKPNFIVTQGFDINRDDLILFQDFIIQQFFLEEEKKNKVETCASN